MIETNPYKGSRSAYASVTEITIYDSLNLIYVK